MQIAQSRKAVVKLRKDGAKAEEQLAKTLQQLTDQEAAQKVRAGSWWSRANGRSAWQDVSPGCVPLADSTGMVGGRSHAESCMWWACDEACPCACHCTLPTLQVCCDSQSGRVVGA